MLSSGMQCYHLELMLSSWTKCYHLGLNFIICDALISSGANVIIWDEMLSGAYFIIWCYHVMLSSGMNTPPFFIFPANFTHSLQSLSAKSPLIWIKTLILKHGIFINLDFVLGYPHEILKTVPQKSIMVLVKAQSLCPRRVF